MGSTALSPSSLGRLTVSTSAARRIDFCEKRSVNGNWCLLLLRTEEATADDASQAIHTEQV